MSDVTVLLPFPEDTDEGLARLVCKDLEERCPGYRFAALMGTSLTSAVVIP